MQRQCYKASIKARMKCFNEYSLKKRLIELFNKNKELFILYKNDSNCIINNVVDTRNYLTHYDKRLEKKQRKN